jgi:hypothetical protein
MNGVSCLVWSEVAAGHPRRIRLSQILMVLRTATSLASVFLPAVCGVAAVHSVVTVSAAHGDEPSGTTAPSLTRPVPTGAAQGVDASGTAASAAIAATPSTTAAHPLLPAIQIAQGCLTKLQTVTDYEATFFKRERVQGRLIEQTMLLRFRETPFSVYLKFGEPYAGREILYVDGQNNNQLLAHEGSGLRSLVGTVSLAVNSVEATHENRYPITMIGMRQMTQTILQQWQNETPYGEIEVKFYPSAKLRGRPCKVVESVHPRPRRQFKFHLTRLFVDVETHLPVRVEQYAFPPTTGAEAPIEETYEYANVRINPGFSDHDFSRANREYGFSP